MKYRKRITAAVLAGLMLCTNMGGANTVYGAPAGVDVDETMYVNLDYYGKTSKINVVKSLSPNGNTEFTDYGKYENVVNMSNTEKPQIGDGTVTWSFPADQRGRFYYQCTIGNDQVTLPWDFDVSYKLNGVPTNADQLAGASGLVEINVKAVPNDSAGEYYRNNLLLMVAFPVDLTKCYSVDAEGAQTQNLGETTAVVFTALPGEEGDYTVRIGTDSFESIGVIMAMAPGTVEDLKHIKDLKEAKDTWQDAGDQLYDSLEQMAKSVEAMRDGVNEVQSGLQSAESARKTWSGSKDDILAGNDQTLAALTAMSGQLETMVPHLQTAKDAAETVHQGMDNIVDTLGEMQDPLRKLHTRLKHVENDMDSLAAELPEIQKLMLQVIALDARFQANEQVTLTGLSQAGQSLLDIEDEYYDEVPIPESSRAVGTSAGTSAGTAGSGNAGGDGAEAGTDAAESASTGTDISGRDTTEDGAANSAASTGGNSTTGAADHDGAAGTSGSDTSSPDNADSAQQDVQASIMPHFAPLVAAAGGYPMDSADLYQSLMAKTGALEKLSKQSSVLVSTMGDMMENSADAAKYSRELIDNMDFLIEDITALSDSLDIYYPDLQDALTDAKELVSRTAEALNSGISTMTILQNTLKNSSDDFDAAARESLRGSMELLDKSLGVLDGTTAMRQAGRTMKDTLDNELDKFDTDNRFLFMDPEAEKVSFTSEKNKSPKTLQIVLRTEEISLDDDDNKPTDIETEKEQMSPLGRMWNVLVKMWKAIVSIFKDR